LDLLLGSPCFNKCAFTDFTGSPKSTNWCKDRVFAAERDSLVRKNNHIVALLAPTGRKISLSRDRILNLETVESVMPKRVEHGQNWPSPRERQILNYHKKHGSTSARFEEVRRKYPNW